MTTGEGLASPAPTIIALPHVTGSPTPAVLRDTSAGTSYYPVRLVFRLYTQLQGSICTSEPRQTSIRVSPDFAMAMHSSPDFGSATLRSLGSPPCCLHVLSPKHSTARFRYACAFQHQTRKVLRLSSPCFKTGRPARSAQADYTAPNSKSPRRTLPHPQSHALAQGSLPSFHLSFTLLVRYRSPPLFCLR